MPYEVVLAPAAVADLRGLKANIRSLVRDALERHLRHSPTRSGRSRIKQLRGRDGTYYRLRVGEIRVFYRVLADHVRVLGIMTKSEASDWLRATGGEQ